MGQDSEGWKLLPVMCDTLRTEEEIRQNQKISSWIARQMPVMRVLWMKEYMSFVRKIDR